MIAPPPMPNSPARKPASTPPATMTAASQASSLNGIPEIIGTGSAPGAARRLGCDVRQIRARVHHEIKRLAQDRNASAGLDGLRRDVTAESARARHALKQAENVPGHRMQPCAVCKLAFDVGEESFKRGLGRRERRGRAIDQRI